MKNTKILKALKVFLKFLWSIFVVLGIMVICIFGYLSFFDDKARCLDLGKIYDPEQKVCRDDCLTWDKHIGCVPITEENCRRKEKGFPLSL